MIDNFLKAIDAHSTRRDWSDLTATVKDVVRSTEQESCLSLSPCIAIRIFSCYIFRKQLLFTHLRKDPVCTTTFTKEQQTNFNFASWCLSLTCLKGRIALDSCSLIQTQFDFHQNTDKVPLSNISLEEPTSKVYSPVYAKRHLSERQSIERGKFFLFHVFQEGSNTIPELLWRLITHSCCRFNNSNISEYSSRKKHSRMKGLSVFYDKTLST